jgi:hypothetical protein
MRGGGQGLGGASIPGGGAGEWGLSCIRGRGGGAWGAFGGGRGQPFWEGGRGRYETYLDPSNPTSSGCCVATSNFDIS